MCKCDSLYRTITKFSFFAVLEGCLIYECETECSLYPAALNADVHSLVMRKLSVRLSNEWIVTKRKKHLSRFLYV